MLVNFANLADHTIEEIEVAAGLSVELLARAVVRDSRLRKIVLFVLTIRADSEIAFRSQIGVLGSVVFPFRSQFRGFSVVGYFCRKVFQRRKIWVL